MSGGDALAVIGARELSGCIPTTPPCASLHFQAAEPIARPEGLVVIVPGAGGINYPEYAAGYRDLAVSLAAKGLIAVNFCPRGYGPSRGMFTHGSCVEDIATVLAWAQSRYGQIPMYAHARSAGCGIILTCSALGMALGAVALWGCPPSIRQFYTPGTEKAAMAKFLVARGVRPDPVHFIEEILDPEDSAHRVRCPVLLAGSLDDPYVSLTAYAAMFAAFPVSSKQMTIFAGLPHMVLKASLGSMDWDLYVSAFAGFFKEVGQAGR